MRFKRLLCVTALVTLSITVNSRTQQAILSVGNGSGPPNSGGNIIYIDLETSNQFQLNVEDFAQITATGKQNKRFTKMIKWYYLQMTDFQNQAKNKLSEISNFLPPDGFLALRLVYELYSATAVNIKKSDYDVVGHDVNLSADDVMRVGAKASGKVGITQAQVLTKLRTIIDS